MAEAVEMVRFTPVSLSLEELSKLWSVLFQTTYALSVAYQGTVVLIEADETARPALPVRARNVTVVPFAQPVVEEIVSAEDADAPLTAASTLLIRGRNLRGDVTRVRIGGAEAEPAAAEAREIALPLSDVDPGVLRAGVQGVQVVHERLLGTPPAPHRGEESNVAALVLRPTIRAAGGDPDEHDVVFTPAPPRITVGVTPTVGREQRAVLLLNPLSGGGTAYRFVAPSRASDGATISFDVPGVASGTYLVRVGIDGAESLLLADAGGVYVRPRVTIP